MSGSRSSSGSLRRVVRWSLVALVSAALLLPNPVPAVAKSPSPSSSPAAPVASANPAPASELPSDTERPVADGAVGGAPARAESPAFVEAASPELTKKPTSGGGFVESKSKAVERGASCVACHEHGTGVAGFLPSSWDHLDCQSWDHPARRVGGPDDGSLDPLVGVVGVEGLRAWDSGRSA